VHGVGACENDHALISCTIDEQLLSYQDPGARDPGGRTVIKADEMGCVDLGCRLRASGVCSVPCAHPLPQKSVACIRHNGLYGYAHRCPKGPLRASDSEMTFACIRFQVTTNQHLDPNFGFYYQIFTTDNGPDRQHR